MAQSNILRHLFHCVCVCVSLVTLAAVLSFPSFPHVQLHLKEVCVFVCLCVSACASPSAAVLCEAACQLIETKMALLVLQMSI